MTSTKRKCQKCVKNVFKQNTNKLLFSPQSPTCYCW